MNKKKIFNDDTVIKNDIYNSLKDLIICSLCSNIMIDSKMCMTCQSSFCNECLEEYLKSNKNKCPKGCNNPNFEKNIEGNNLIVKFSFKCIKCRKEMKYNDLLKHYETECSLRNSTNNNNNNLAHKKTLSHKGFKILTNSQMEQLRNEGNDIKSMVGKK